MVKLRTVYSQLELILLRVYLTVAVPLVIVCVWQAYLTFEDECRSRTLAAAYLKALAPLFVRSCTCFCAAYSLKQI